MHLQSRNGIPFAISVFAKDVTIEKRSESELKQAIEWQVKIFEGSLDAIFISDENSVLTAVNIAACDLTGYSKEELLKRRIPDLHDEPDLEAFSYSVSHDLRAPLRSVYGYTKILVEEYENMLDEEGKRICGIISSSATQMGELIDDLLSFSRIGRTSVKPLLLDMRSIVHSVFEETCTSSQKSKLNCK